MDANISTWLKDRRLELRLSQEDMLARLQLEGLDISRSMISHWENGRYNLPLSDVHAMRAIARTLQVSVADLLIAMGYDTTEANTQMKLSAREHQAIAAWRRGDVTEAVKIIVNG